MQRVRRRLGSDGRIVLPAEYRAALGLRSGDMMLITLDGDTLKIVPDVSAVVAHAQRLVARYIPDDAGLVDSLIRDRRHEARREDRPQPRRHRLRSAR